MKKNCDTQSNVVACEIKENVFFRNLTNDVKEVEVKLMKNDYLLKPINRW